MRAKGIITFVLSVAIACALAHKVTAQEMKSEGKINQVCVNVGNDIRCYEIIREIDNKDYMAYNKAIRERIARKLKELYAYRYRTGDISLLFTLKSDGSLANFDIDRAKSSKDKELVEITELSLKRATPFPRFPETLPFDTLSFSVIISFRDKQES